MEINMEQNVFILINLGVHKIPDEEKIVLDK